MLLTVHRWFANKSCPGNWMYAKMGDLAAKVTAQLGGSASPAPSTDKNLYRVRKSWTDAASQKGAFSVLENAKRCADVNPGYSVFDEKGAKVYPQKTSDPAASNGVPFLVQISITDLNIHNGPGTDYARTQYIPAGTPSWRSSPAKVRPQDGGG